MGVWYILHATMISVVTVVVGYGPRQLARNTLGYPMTLDSAYPRFRNRTAVDSLVEYLRLAIQNGVYVSGDRLPPERVLTEELGIARPTLRQAFDQLKAEGYLEARHGAMAGTFVTDLVVPSSAWLDRMRKDVKELDDIYAYSIMVETAAADMAAHRRTDRDLDDIQLAIDQLRVLVQLHRLGQKPNGVEYSSLRGADTLFHQAISLASRSRRISEAVFWARGELFTAALLVLYDDVLLGQIQEEHEALLAAIRRADGDAARAAMFSHITNGRQRLGALLQM